MKIGAELESLRTPNLTVVNPQEEVREAIVKRREKQLIKRIFFFPIVSPL